MVIKRKIIVSLHFLRFYKKFTDIIPVLDNSCPDNADCSLGVLILDQGKLNYKKNLSVIIKGFWRFNDSLFTCEPLSESCKYFFSKFIIFKKNN